MKHLLVLLKPLYAKNSFQKFPKGQQCIAMPQKVFRKHLYDLETVKSRWELFKELWRHNKRLKGVMKARGT